VLTLEALDFVLDCLLDQFRERHLLCRCQRYNRVPGALEQVFG
jgi:hypothetical protein